MRPIEASIRDLDRQISEAEDLIGLWDDNRWKEFARHMGRKLDMLVHRLTQVDIGKDPYLAARIQGQIEAYRWLLGRPPGTIKGYQDMVKRRDGLTKQADKRNHLAYRRQL